MEKNACGRLLAAQNAKSARTAMGRHMAAIASGNVTKTNVIGLRKAVNHVERLAKGWSGNRCAATPSEVAAALEALGAKTPIVRGELHASGVRLLTDRRYRKRLASCPKCSAAIGKAKLAKLPMVELVKRDTPANPYARSSYDVMIGGELRGYVSCSVGWGDALGAIHARRAARPLYGDLCDREVYHWR